MSIVRIGVIGLREVSEAHIAAIAELREAQLLSVCDAMV